MDDRIVFDREKGEIRIFGRRCVALDVEAFCTDLDSLVGPQVAEVLMMNHERRLGKDDAQRLRQEKPGSSVEEIIGILKEAEILSGTGSSEIALPNAPAEPILIEVSNPCVEETTGSAKSFLFGYWAGALSFLLGKEYDIGKVTLNKPKNILSAQIVIRSAR